MVIGRVRRVVGHGLAADAALTTAVGMGIFFLSALTGPLLARSLGTSARGDLASVLVPTQLLGYVLVFGLPHSAAYFARDWDIRTLVMSAWATAAVIAVPVMVLGVVLAPSYLSGHDPLTVGWFVAFLALWLCFSPVAASLDALRGTGRIRVYNTLRALPALLNAVGLVVLAVFGGIDLRSALIVNFASLAVGWAITLMVAGTFPGGGFRRAAMGSQVRYGMRAALGTLAQTVVARLDQFLLVPLVPSATLGLYVVAATGASLTSPLGQGVALALFPHVRAGGADGSDEATRKAVRWTMIGSGSMALMMAAVSPWLIPALFGSSFRGAVVPLLILLPGQVLNDIATVHASRLEADGRPGAASQALIIAAVFTAVGLALVVGPFGIKGAAAVTSASQVVYLITTTTMLRRSARLAVA